MHNFEEVFAFANKTDAGEIFKLPALAVRGLRIGVTVLCFLHVSSVVVHCVVAVRSFVLTVPWPLCMLGRRFCQFFGHAC